MQLEESLDGGTHGGAIHDLDAVGGRDRDHGKDTGGARDRPIAPIVCVVLRPLRLGFLLPFLLPILRLTSAQGQAGRAMPPWYSEITKRS